MAGEKTEDAPLRPPGLMEQFNISRNYIGFYNAVGMTAIYTVPKSSLQKFGSVQDLVYASLTLSLNDHPFLGVTIEDEGTSEPKWVRLDKIDLREVVKIIDVPSIDSVSWIREAHAAPFRTEAHLPLWRVIVAPEIPRSRKGEDLISFGVGLIYHHGIGDGLSGAAFHLSLRETISTLLVGARLTSISPTPTVPKLPLIPSLEMGSKLPVSIWFLLRIAFATFIYSRPDALEWTSTPISAATPRPPICNLRSIFLPSKVLAAILSHCRTNNTTLTSLIAILVARKLALLYPDYTHFSASIPLSLRRFTGHSNRDMGVLVSDCRVQFASESSPTQGYIPCLSEYDASPSSDDVLWDSARKVKNVLSEKGASSRNQGVGLLKFAGDFQKFFMNTLGTKRVYSFEVTNVGVIDGGVRAEGERDEVSFDRVVFTSGGCTFSPPMVFRVATAKCGDLCINLGWESEVVEDEKAEEMIRWLEEVLRDLAEVER